MYKTVNNFEELKAAIEHDKQATGLDAGTRNRYPLRFVLFDNFSDCYEFVEYLQSEQSAQVESVDKWIDPEYRDLIVSYDDLAESIEKFVKQISPYDCVIAPFSELARFYDNESKHEFDALITTIKGIQTSHEGYEAHQRVYIPIVGLEGKMEAFKDDTQMIAYRMQSSNRDLNYRLILTPKEDYGVQGLEAKYTVVNDIKEWLKIWKDTRQQKTTHIICKSMSIYAFAGFAQPDNAFSYYTCHNAYEFLTGGLQLPFGGLQYELRDGDNWEILAQSINLAEPFTFEKYVKSTLSVDEVADYKDFIRLWFLHTTTFERWLLVRYYKQKETAENYLLEVLAKTTNYGTNEFVENLAMTLPSTDNDIAIRKYCLVLAAKKNILLSDTAESQVSRALTSLPERVGYYSAKNYFTGVSRKEREIALRWLGQGHFTPADIKGFFPDLFYYINEGTGVAADVPNWVEKYMLDYKLAKLRNVYTPEIDTHIKRLNASESTFDAWYNDFKTTYTHLKNRGDVEVFFWIDGLGIDWIPLVKQIIEERRERQIFLNEVMIARAQLPTKTSINKTDLERLLPEGQKLEKIGDLDSMAHSTANIAPFTLIHEIKMVRAAIEEILDRFVGKKIAIISDHGLSYLSQLRQGLHLAGVDSDHRGRIAEKKTKGAALVDETYFRMEDGKTLCALRHESLCDKVPDNQGCHGGCTPEEVLVPIFIISSAPAASNWQADIVDPNISGTEPRVKFDIKNLPSTEKPYVTYANTKYAVHHVNGNIYETADLTLDPNDNDISLTIGMVSRPYKIYISTGIEEDDLF